MFCYTAAALLCLLLALPLQVASQTNLPPAEPGIFTAQGSSLINAPIEDVWDAILDFESYPDWNPFARSMVLIDSVWTKNPLEDQTPQVGSHIQITAAIPPLELPVDANSTANPFQTQQSLEVVTHIDHDNHRAAWKQVMLPSLLMIAERWTAVSVVDTPDGPRTLYESREVFQSLLSIVVGLLFQQGLQKGFDAQALAIKYKFEGMPAP